MIYPKHIAFIPDGNRTWAKEQGLPKFVGHTKGFENVINLTKYIFTNTPIKVVTVWGLSTENLKNRPKEELDYLFNIYKNWGDSLENFLKENKINFRRVGSSEGLPEDLVEFLIEKQKNLSFDTDRYAVVAINYGGRDEILRGVNKLLDDFKRVNTKFFEKVDEEIFSKYLDFGDLPPVDLVIRTKGDVARRLSGFMLWWIGYAELYFTKKKIPEFTIEDLNEALKRFDSITKNRNFGK